jgi:allophanate hydrolase subunit 1
MEEQKQNELNIELSEEMAEGTYANMVVITHSVSEFVLDFVNIMPGMPKSKVKSRLIMTPHHAKRFMHAIIDNIQKFETQNGVINDGQGIEIPLHFGGPTAQA